MSDKLISRSEDFNEWYNTLVLKADLADYGPVRGTMIVKPYGWALWENIQQALDRRFKATGHQNAAFPMFIPESFIKREAKHVAGFSPELAVVTHAGGEKLEEPLVVRPTSETIIGHTYAKWVQSYRDLPILINLWNSVVRWELRTKLFLRTSEFYWQEGHTAHATAEEAAFETRQMLDVYTDFAVNDMAIPVIPGEKSEAERFAGADRTFTIEAMMGDRRALQAGTSHNLGQNFARAFDIKYLDQNNTLQYCWTTSWGLSTRVIGAIIMVHGDDQGLILPPRLAPYQTVIVPIFRSDEEKGPVMAAVERLGRELAAGGIRVKVDDREQLTPGFKFNDWELRGVPSRVEVGPRDVANNSVALARRDVPGRAGKQFVAQDGLVDTVRQLLDDIQAAMLEKARQFREANTHMPQEYDSFKEAVQDGFARVWWAGTPADEARIKEETKATIRCFPLDQPEASGVCFYTGRPGGRMAIFARAY
ncbi:MAG: proline--tRNA ligase [Chloroflexi bacterium]|nr:proline--tRNA ligase [Chloroflexota bacterium]MCI0577237.1 proline--tRNA ligase [Chloroflexota bacterium]MCI0646718.1 proline--tRNA ligase [Chloroflexota bacterium]MCI0731352.1 proline--tRNA ligase [Chloroflexota bacterium]